MTKQYQYARQGFVYSLHEIIHKLELRDSPCLQFVYKGVSTPIQDSHVSEAELETKCPSLMQTRWIYQYETPEWIPVFNVLADDHVKLVAMLDVEESIDPFADDVLRTTYWATPKAFPRDQYYKDPTERQRLKDDYNIDLDNPNWKEELHARRVKLAAETREARKHQHLSRGY